jgi:hypothetical protein
MPPLDILAALLLPTRRKGRLTPWQEYQRAFAVDLQWLRTAKRTGDPGHRAIAVACQQIAHEWLQLAHYEHQISVARFRRENGRLKVSARVLEPV